MRKPKILIGLTYFLPNISGVTQYAVILAEELQKRKYEVNVICSGKDREVNKVKINGIWGVKAGKGFVMPTYFLRSLPLVKQCEVVNCHLPSVESFWLALWAKIFHKKLIVTHHCEFNFTGRLSNIFISLITFPIHWWVYLAADKIVAYTKDYADTSVFLRLFSDKIVYILPPIKIKSTPNPRHGGQASFDKRRGKKNGEKVVGFVGRIGWEKGLPYLVEAMKYVKAKLMLIGPYKDVIGDNTYKNLVKNENIEFVGPVDHCKLNKYYERFDCLVLPSTNNLETFGIVQAEAMVCGTPVVATNLPGVRVPIQMTLMGEICRIAEVTDLAEKINLVLGKGKKYYQKIAKNLDKFDYKKTTEAYEKLFGVNL